MTDFIKEKFCCFQLTSADVKPDQGFQISHSNFLDEVSLLTCLNACEGGGPGGNPGKPGGHTGGDPLMGLDF